MISFNPNPTRSQNAINSAQAKVKFYSGEVGLNSAQQPAKSDLNSIQAKNAIQVFDRNHHVHYVHKK